MEPAYHIVATVRNTKPKRRERVTGSMPLAEAKAWTPSTMDKRHYKYFRVVRTKP